MFGITIYMWEAKLIHISYTVWNSDVFQPPGS